ncbi:MAG TPA: pyridoxamine 5'-phosphate oxidase family protein [Actinospica sp.]|nr:pyridoxamine 5'-phosphate oxidase family protein [Actinospica sp.]
MNDECERHNVMDQARAGTLTARHMSKLTRDEAMRLLGGVSLGRIVFTQDALPTIRPVNHLLDADGHIVIRTHHGAALTDHTAGAGTRGGVVVAYEAEQIDPDTHLGWSVIVTGYARLVRDPDQLARYQAMLEPWVDHTMDQAVRIRPDIVTGFRLTATPDPHPSETGRSGPCAQ